jgi:hypothetical protein
MKLRRTILIAAAAFAVAAPAVAQAEAPQVFATVTYYDAQDAEQKKVECAWATAPSTKECWTTVQDGPDAVRSMVELGYAKAVYTIRHPLGQTSNVLRKRADGTWHFSGSGTSSGVERRWGFVSDTNGENWVRYEVNDQASTASVVRAATAKAAVNKAGARLKRKLRAQR